MLHIVYRSYGGENTKGRPAFYSKILALVSVVRAVGEVGAELVFLNDGPIPAERLRVMERSGEVLTRAQLGMRGSLRTALKLPVERGWADEDLVWFAEDDYLYLPNAFSGLNAAASVFPDAAYFALYALIGDRLPNGKAPTDTVVPAGWKDSEPRLVRGHPWRRALSTTSTFGARIGALKQDRLMMSATMWSSGSWDHTTCLMYQGFQPFSPASLAQFFGQTDSVKDGFRRAGISATRIGLAGFQAARKRVGYSGRLLIAPEPALVTHLEDEYMAVGTDWNAVAADTKRWGAERGLI